jgi:hypothetical protein
MRKRRVTKGLRKNRFYRDGVARCSTETNSAHRIDINIVSAIRRPSNRVFHSLVHRCSIRDWGVKGWRIIGEVWLVVCALGTPHGRVLFQNNRRTRTVVVYVHAAIAVMRTWIRCVQRFHSSFSFLFVNCDSTRIARIFDIILISRTRGNVFTRATLLRAVLWSLFTSIWDRPYHQQCQRQAYPLVTYSLVPRAASNVPETTNASHERDVRTRLFISFGRLGPFTEM